MSRRKRTWLPGIQYHIVCRGNGRAPLFIYEEDFNRILCIFHDVYEQIPFEIASYCLMTNHFHLQLSSQQTHISKIMSAINKKYAEYFNKRYDLCGHVFEKRFFDEAIIGTKSMLEVSYYIHLNPVEAGMVQHPEDYRWSSYQFFKNSNLSLPPYMKIDSLLNGYEAASVEEKRQQYCQSVMKACEEAMVMAKWQGLR